MQNPFVYGEVVPAGAFVDRVAELDRLVGDLAGRPEGVPDLAAPLRQVVAHPAGARGDGAARRADRRGHRQQLQLVRRVSRGLRARAGRRGDPKWDRARTWLTRGHPVGARRDPVHARRVAARLADRVVSRPCNRSATSRGSRRRSSRCRPGSPRPAGARSSSRSTSSRRSATSTADRSSTRMRAAVQHQRDVGYVFAGSEPSLMERMLGPKRPFYKAGPVMRLEKIPADEFAASIDARFSRSGMKPEAGPRRRDRRARRQPAVRRAAARARDVGRGARVAAGAGRRSTICTRRCAGCSPSSRRCSRRSGSG